MRETAKQINTNDRAILPQVNQNLFADTGYEAESFVAVTGTQTETR